jgi:hypothetical protein
MGERTNAYKVLFRTLNGKTLGICRHRWEDNMKMDLKKILS